jgi:predicted amidohydrolase
LHIACFQLAQIEEEPKEQRVQRVLDAIRSHSQSYLFILPELLGTGYFRFDRYGDEAEPLHGPTVQALCESARLQEVFIMAGSFLELQSDGGIANCALLIDPEGKVIHIYRKVHLFGYQSQEATLLVPGEDLPVVDTALGMLATSTCYDLRFPEIYRVFSSKGAQIMIIPAAWPATRSDHWRVLLQARAIENLSFVIGCNGAGVSGGVPLAGQSAVVSPWGQILAEAGRDEELLSCDIDLQQVNDMRREFPALDHRRIAIAERAMARCSPGRSIQSLRGVSRW